MVYTALLIQPLRGRKTLFSTVNKGKNKYPFFSTNDGKEDTSFPSDNEIREDKFPPGNEGREGRQDFLSNSKNRKSNFFFSTEEKEDKG